MFIICSFPPGDIPWEISIHHLASHQNITKNDGLPSISIPTANTTAAASRQRECAKSHQSQWKRMDTAEFAIEYKCSWLCALASPSWSLCCSGHWRSVRTHQIPPSRPPQKILIRRCVIDVTTATSLVILVWMTFLCVGLLIVIGRIFLRPYLNCMPPPTVSTNPSFHHNSLQKKTPLPQIYINKILFRGRVIERKKPKSNKHF